MLAVGGLSTKTAAAAAAAAAARRNLRRPNHFRLSTGTHGRAAVALSLTLSQLITDDTRARRTAAAADGAVDKWSPTSVYDPPSTAQPRGTTVRRYVSK